MAIEQYLSNEYWVKSSNKLGGIYPYYNNELTSSFSIKFSEIISEREDSNLPIKLDATSLVVKMCLPYLIGDRTLIKGVKKAPWMSRLAQDGLWKPHNLPDHGNLKPNKIEFIKTLKNSLLDEAREFISNKKSVGILLSGGMDSRVLAGIIRELQVRDSLPINVIALTWGSKSSRDVIYAQRIANKFGWESIHFPLSAETLLENIKYAGINGAEYSAFHLHAMPEVSKISGIDLIIAGSYGDSVGRAEFSGVHLTNLKPIVPKVLDQFGLIKGTALKMAKIDIKSDLNNSSFINKSTGRIRTREIEQEMHYMRRMLQGCMQNISNKIPIYQLFTSPSVFGLMWSLDPSIRDNDWYTLLLNELPGSLLEIPWARNGKRYDNQNEDPLDNLSKSYHSYGRWLRNDLKQDVLLRLNNNKIRELPILNQGALDHLINNWQKSNTDSISSLDESVIWLCSLHDMLETYEIDSFNLVFNESIFDYIRGHAGNAYANLFVQARNRLRN